jgi:hypothetical protein
MNSFLKKKKSQANIFNAYADYNSNMFYMTLIMGEMSPRFFRLSSFGESDYNLNPVMEGFPLQSWEELSRISLA